MLPESGGQSGVFNSNGFWTRERKERTHTRNRGGTDGSKVDGCEADGSETDGFEVNGCEENMCEVDGCRRGSGGSSTAAETENAFWKPERVQNALKNASSRWRVLNVIQAPATGIERVRYAPANARVLNALAARVLNAFKCTLGCPPCGVSREAITPKSVIFNFLEKTGPGEIFPV
eukprot:gene25195-biopygen13505